MFKNLFSHSENRPLQTRNAFWLLPTLLIVYITSSVVYVVALAQTGAAQLKIALAVTLLLVVIASIALWLNRIGRGTQGTILDIWAMVFTFPIISTLFVGNIGLALGFITPIATMLLAGALLTRKQAIWAIPVGILSGLVSILLDLYWPYSRVDVPLLHVFASCVFLLGVVVFLVIVIRQFANYAIRTKLIISFVLIGVVSVSSVVYFVDRSSRTSLTDTIGNNLSGLANGEAIQVGQTLGSELDKLKGLALTKAVQDRAEAGTAADSLSPAEIQTLDQQWRAADAANNSSDPLVARVLSDSLSAELLKYQAQFPENVEVFLTDLPGVSLATTDRTSDYLQSDEGWWQAAYKNGQYIGQPEFDASTKTLAINMAVAVRASGGNQIVGVLRTTVNINSLANVLQAGLVGRTGQTNVYLPDGQEIKLVTSGAGKSELTVEKTNLDVKTLLKSPAKYMNVTLDNSPSLLSLASVSVSDNDAEAVLIKNLGWYIGTHQDQSEALLPVTTQTRGNIVLAVIITVLAALAAVGLAQVLSGPIIRLNVAAEKVAAGDLSVQAKVETNDETGTLATTFNSMVSQLRTMIGSLEQRVAAATRNLTLAAEIGRNVAQVHDLDTLLKSAVDLIQDRFNLYYTQVYLLDPTGRQLVLRAGIGEAGQQLLARRHHLPIDLASLNGTAAVEKRAVIVENTETSTTHRPNPLLPDTRSEMVIPLMVRERVVGTLDMQSSQAGALNKENLAAFETLAGQLAIAVENAALLAETEAARAAVEAQSRRLIRSGWQDFLNAVERGERLGYTYDLENITSFTEPISAEPDGRALVAAIPVSNEPVGVVKFEGGHVWSEDDAALVDSIAHQLGRQVENLRLLAQADQYRAEAEQALHRLTRQGWEAQFAAHPGAETGFTYDLNTISPLSAAEMSNTQPAVTQPLEILGEKIGELSVAGTNSTQDEVAELLSMVSEQLSARVENLRLFEETERGQIEVEKRARQLAAVAEVSTVSARELEVEKMLNSVVHLTQRQFGLYHAHIFLYDEKAEELKIAACGWKEGDEHEGTHDTTNVPIAQEQSLAARAARTRQAVIVNDMQNEPGWLPDPLLPDTASELAVPLIIGDQVLGVLDVQSERPNAFSEEDAHIQTTLASQVAIALQNARSFDQVQKQAERETKLNLIGQKIRSATTVEAVLQIAARELGHALGAPLTIAQLGLKDKK
jgi:GAF domain-containing protein/HAMP domain-containing protein